MTTEPPPRRAYPDDLTADERKAIDDLVKLSKRWPRTIGLFSWSGALRVTDRSEAVLGYLVGGEIRTIDDCPLEGDRIPNDGGDPYEAE